MPEPRDDQSHVRVWKCRRLVAVSTVVVYVCGSSELPRKSGSLESKMIHSRHYVVEDGEGRWHGGCSQEVDLHVHGLERVKFY